MVMVDFPLDEAQGVLAALDGKHVMSARETACAAAGRTRLLQAVRVETGPGNTPVVHDPTGQDLQGASAR